jgi:hypothetical protein
MESIIALLCIAALCVVVYAAIRMTQINKDYPVSCQIMYIPRSDDISYNGSPHMDILEHEKHDEKFRHASFSTAPMGVSEIESIIPSLATRYHEPGLRVIG